MFDDWFCFHGRPDKGEQRACREWLDANPQISLVPYRDFHWAGRSFLVNLDRRLRSMSRARLLAQRLGKYAPAPDRSAVSAE